MSAIVTWAKKTAIDDTDLTQTKITVERQFEVLGKVVTDNHRDDAETYPSPGMDPIVQALEGVVEGRVGGKLSQDDFDAAVAEGKRRHANEEPPGYKEKEAEKQHLPEGVAGDYLVWVQSIAESRRRGLDLLIVTSDEKEDWYWRAKETVIGPRPELAKEFWDATGRRLFLLTPIEFMRRYKSQGGNVSEQALTEAEGKATLPEQVTYEERRDTAQWSLDAVRQLLAILDTQAPVQAAVIRAAAANGGLVDRQKVFELGNYGPKRMLRGFTRPVRRVSRLLQETGDLDLQAPEMLTPRYDFYGLADAFQIPDEVVELLDGRDDDTEATSPE